jgi:hypothetical protein
MLGLDGNLVLDQPQVVYVSQYLGSHTRFPQEVLMSIHNQVQRKESKKFHGEL